MKQSYRVTEDADMMAPKWLTVRFNYATVKLIYGTVDGVARVKGVRIGDEVAGIGDIIHFDGKRISVERSVIRKSSTGGKCPESKRSGSY